jgi:hypothetical protein
MKEELTMIEKNETWILIDRPIHKKVIGVKWIFKTKIKCKWKYQQIQSKACSKMVFTGTRY